MGTDGESRGLSKLFLTHFKEIARLWWESPKSVDCVCRYHSVQDPNDQRNFEENTTPRLGQDAKSRNANLEFVQIVILEHFYDLKWRDIVVLKMLANVRQVE